MKYIQLLLLKKILENISHKRRLNLEDDDDHNEIDGLKNNIIVRSELRNYLIIKDNLPYNFK